MGLNLGMFRTPRHKVFNYQPLYYDERKEALNERLEKARRKDSGEYVPGENIRGAFSNRLRFDVQRSRRKDSVRRMFTFVALVIFMLALVYIAKYMGYLI